MKNIFCWLREGVQLIKGTLYQAIFLLLPFHFSMARELSAAAGINSKDFATFQCMLQRSKSIFTKKRVLLLFFKGSV